MKKIGVLFVFALFVLLISSGFVYAQEVEAPPSVTGDLTGSDVDKIQGFADDIPLDKETGGLDEQKFEGYKSKADIRIEAIDAWLDNNVSWLKWIFGMKPAVSFLFGVNFLLILFFVNFLFLNSRYNITSILPFSSTVSMIISLLILVGLIGFGVPAYIATQIDSLVGLWWVKALVIAGIIIALVVSNLISGKIKELKEKSAKAETDEDRRRFGKELEVIQATAKGIAEG